MNPLSRQKIKAFLSAPTTAEKVARHIRKVTGVSLKKELEPKKISPNMSTYVVPYGVAGGAVANTILKLLYGIDAPLNDVDIYYSSPWGAPSFRRMPSRNFDVELVYDAYRGNIQPIYAYTYCVVSTRRRGMVNDIFVSTAGFIRDNKHKLHCILSGFDLNACQAGLCIPDGRTSFCLTYTEAFVDFLVSMELQVKIPVTPYHSLIRLAKKAKELGANVDLRKEASFLKTYQAMGDWLNRKGTRLEERSARLYSGTFGKKVYASYQEQQTALAGLCQVTPSALPLGYGVGENVPIAVPYPARYRGLVLDPDPLTPGAVIYNELGAQLRHGSAKPLVPVPVYPGVMLDCGLYTMEIDPELDRSAELRQMLASLGLSGNPGVTPALVPYLWDHLFRPAGTPGQIMEHLSPKTMELIHNPLWLKNRLHPSRARRVAKLAEVILPLFDRMQKRKVPLEKQYLVAKKVVRLRRRFGPGLVNYLVGRILQRQSRFAEPILGDKYPRNLERILSRIVDGNKEFKKPLRLPQVPKLIIREISSSLELLKLTPAVEFCHIMIDLLGDELRTTNIRLFAVGPPRARHFFVVGRSKKQWHCVANGRCIERILPRMSTAEVFLGIAPPGANNDLPPEGQRLMDILQAVRPWAADLRLPHSDLAVFARGAT